MKNEEYISIVKAHQNLIYKICNNYCKDAASKKDLEQEILIQIWLSLKKFDGRVKISTWIYRVALNTAINFYKSNIKRKANTFELRESILTLPENEYDSKTDDKIEQIYLFIQNLNELDKALMLLLLDDKSYQQIADILGLSKTNVSTKIYRIKNSLRTYFNNKKN